MIRLCLSLVLLLLAIAGDGCADGAGPVTSAVSDISTVLNPDGSKFAFAMVVERNRSSAVTTDNVPFVIDKVVEVWVYDLAFRSGPRRIANWREASGNHPRLIAWANDGLYLASLGRIEAKGVKIDPSTGRHHAIPRLPTNILDQSRPAGHSPGEAKDRMASKWPVEERLGEFFLWDPLKRHSEFLFAISNEHDGLPERYPNSRQMLRDSARLADGVQDIWDVRIDPTASGWMVRVETFVKRPQKARQYKLKLDLEVPDPSVTDPNVIRPVLRAVADTTVELGLENETIDVFVPYHKARDAFRDSHKFVNGRGETYSTALETKLVPVLLPEDTRMPRGVAGGNVTWTIRQVSIPMRIL